MARNTRNTAILAKIETTYAIDAVPTGAANALLISNASYDISYSNVNRDLLRGYFGGSEQLAGTRFVDLSFDVEISSSGTAGTAPAWGPLLQACGFGEVVTAATRVDYTPVSTAFKSLTIYYHDDGVLHKALGCMGNVEFAMGVSERPLLKFTFMGVDGGTTEVVNPTTTLTAWRTPMIITDFNTGDIKLGGAYSAGAITGGTPYVSRGLNLNMTNEVVKLDLLGGLAVDITDRDVAGSMQLELSAAQEVAFYTDVNANAVTSLSFEHGSVAGSKIIFHAPRMQRINPKHVDYEGRIHHSFDLRLLPSTGNDDLRIIAL